MVPAGAAGVKDVSRLGPVGQRRSCAIFSKQLLTWKDGWDGKEEMENGKGVGNRSPLVQVGWPSLGWGIPSLAGRHLAANSSPHGWGDEGAKCPSHSVKGAPVTC